MRRLLIDGDGCPVVREVIQLAEEFKRPVVIITDYAHYSEKIFPDWVDHELVDMGSDAADFRIFQLADPGDILITQDYGLASLLVGKIRVVHHSGKEYTADNLPRLLEQRHHAQMMRRSGHHTKGPRQFTNQDRQQFSQGLRAILQEEE
ncbi:YaiI/YqxD family protein [Hutsoniella sourekii]